MKKTLCLFALLLSTHTILASGDHPHRANTHAPIGVMGDHTHNQGELMFSYRYMNMSMSGLRQGSDDLSTVAALADFMMVPIDMDMDMHMFGLMYAPSDRITLMAMLNYQENDMLIQNRMGNRFRTASAGMGDTKLSALVKLKSWDSHHLHLNVGLSVPTGSINPRDNTPMANNMLLPYPMRLSSGTYDANFGLTWNLYHDNYSLGSQLLSTIRTGENSQNYRLGHENKLNFWVNKSLGHSWSLSGRMEAKNIISIKASDRRLMMMANMTPTAHADNSGGNFLTMGIGLNYVSNADNWTNGHRLALEFQQPLIQDVDGVQMKTDHSITIGWQKAF